MQPPPLPVPSVVHYSVPRNVILKIWWRRTLFSPKRLRSFGLLVVGVIAIGIAAQDHMIYILEGAVLLLAGLLFVFYRNLSNAIDETSHLTDHKTLEFSTSKLIVTGPDWKSELPWSHFRGFSEDPTYFYLHLDQTGLVSIIPKDAFTMEQQQYFRECAKAVL